ncbi:MAG: flagellar hook-length control protein FliK [Chloroflexota bacterium]
MNLDSIEHQLTAPESLPAPPATGLLPAQAPAGAAARSIVLRVGQEMFATILDMVGQRALLDVGGGQRLAARLQTDQPLSPGQTVALQVADASPGQITLRLMTPGALQAQPAPAAAAQILTSLGLPDDALNRQALMALVSQGEPVSIQSIQDVRAVALGLRAASPAGMRAVAFLLANDLPPTPGLLDVARQGLSGASTTLATLAAQVRQQATQLLRWLPTGGASDLDGLAAQLRQLLAEVATAGEGRPPDAARVQAAVRELATSLESELGRAPMAEAPTAPGTSPARGADASQAAPAASQLAAESGSSGAFARVGGAAPGGTGPAVAAFASSSPGVEGFTADGGAGRALAAETPTPPVPTGLAGSAAGASAADPPGALGVATPGPSAAPIPSPETWSATPSLAEPALGVPEQVGSGLPDGPAARFLGFEPLAGGPSEGAGEAQRSGLVAGPATPAATSPDAARPVATGSLSAGNPVASAVAQPGSSPNVGALPLAQPDLPAPLPVLLNHQAQLAVRQIIVRLDEALAPGTLPAPARAMALVLRDSAQQLVHAVQFQQLQNSLSLSRPVDPGFVSFPLPLLAQRGPAQAELRVYYREEGGARSIDPEDVRVALQLELSNLKKVNVTLHLFRRQIVCQVQAESRPAEQALKAAAPDLERALRGLGYGVEPIRCSLAPILGTEPADDGSRRSVAGSLPATLARVNVRA